MYDKQIQIRVDEKLNNQLEEEAKKKKLPVSTFIRTILADYFQPTTTSKRKDHE